MKGMNFQSPASKYSTKMYAKMKKYQQKYGFEIGTGEHDAWNNEADAFKHTFAAVDFALKYTAGTSKIFGDIHEWQGRNDMGQTSGEENMDKWNNAEGRKIAQKIAKQVGNLAQLKLNAWNGAYDDLIAEEVMKKMRKGELITDPSDPRKYNDKISKSEKFFNNIDKTYINVTTTSKNFSDQIREDYRKLQKERYKRIFARSKSGDWTFGHWVTIDGNHVFIED